jgi:hypothetical protein
LVVLGLLVVVAVTLVLFFAPAGHPLPLIVDLGNMMVTTLPDLSKIQLISLIWMACWAGFISRSLSLILSTCSSSSLLGLWLKAW